MGGGTPKGPKQQKEPDLPESPKQPYGEPLKGSHDDKKKKGTREKNNPHHGL